MHDTVGRRGAAGRRLTAPFGARGLTAAQIAAQIAAHEAPAVGRVAHKWVVVRDITAARAQLGVSAQALAVLEALVSFLPETVLAPEAETDLVVWPSNRSLSARANGLSDASLRRHLAALIEAGLVIRRDSPNGKRFARRGEGGQLTHAYGFDLAPLAVRADEFGALAEAARAEILAQKLAREKATLLRRDCAKLLDALDRQADAPPAGEEGGGFRARYSAALAACPRRPTPAQIAALGDELEGLALAVSEALAPRQESKKISGSAAQNERHLQNSKGDGSVSEPAFEMGQKESGAPEPARADVEIRTTYPLATVLDACPKIREVIPSGIRSWRELVDAAEKVRSWLGISPSAWKAAREAMGEEAAAVTIAAILERQEQITSPGGYLRTLTERKRAGTYSLGPVLQALNRARLAQLDPGGFPATPSRSVARAGTIRP
ncbi:plasmid replication protein RepC [Methylorubrum rhodesianum]|jgi:replication initiation protein RepC|uniref:plasmid replication protein RepC n=1 Tax=Methylobacteriaceae TaxID=119045 RepID=UPI001F1438F8|nr:plasmid replication protein RepC [Methylobacterium organophilum]UMY20298.1 replication initiation protein RepC [Methylobacterium organophilum]HSI10935.1 plasmid replication protein RepC [Chthoniobacter sp.]